MLHGCWARPAVKLGCVSLLWDHPFHLLFHALFRNMQFIVKDLVVQFMCLLWCNVCASAGHSECQNLPKSKKKEERGNRRLMLIRRFVVDWTPNMLRVGHVWQVCCAWGGKCYNFPHKNLVEMSTRCSHNLSEGWLFSLRLALELEVADTKLQAAHTLYTNILQKIITWVHTHTCGSILILQATSHCQRLIAKHKGTETFSESHRGILCS